MEQTQTTLQTEFRKKKEERELAIYNDFQEMKKPPGSMTTAIWEALKVKYEIAAKSTVWAIVKRVEQRLKDQEAAEQEIEKLTA